MFNQYPYLNLNDLNLDYLLNEIKSMYNEVTNFVSINAIKYANPIQWNITRQYEKNTVVIDPLTGTAYISVAAVPSGVALTRAEYWTVVFDLGSFVVRAAKNFTTRYEEETTLTATFPTTAGEWVVWGDTLYIANVNITAGDSYVVGGNIRRITVEEVKNTIMQVIADNYNDIVAMIGDLNGLTTEDKTNVVAAINSLKSALDDEVTTRQNADDTLQDNIDAEALARYNADDTLNNDLTNFINSKTGDLDDLVTTVKSNLVAAINEVANMPKGVILNVKDYGAVGDGVTNDFTAINNAINDADEKGLTTIYFPSGKYNCGSGAFTLNTSKIQFVGGGNSELISSGLSSGAFITLSSVLSLEQYNYARVPLKDICIVGDYFTDTSAYGVVGVKMGTDTTFIAPHCILENVTIRNFAVGLELSSAYKTTYLNCSFIANNRGISIPSDGVQQAVPCIFVSCWWECNNYAFYTLASGYNSISIFGGAFEYNRSIFTGYTKMVFVGVRFEYDAHASCEPSLAIRSIYNQSPLTGSQSVTKFLGCFFLELNNFAANVQHWITNPYVASNFNAARIYGTGGDPVTFEFIACEFESANSISGYYYIATDKYYGAGNYSKTIGGANMIDPSQVVTGANGFIS